MEEDKDQLEIFSPTEMTDFETLEPSVMQKITSDESAGRYTAERLKRLKPKIFNAAKAMLASNLPLTYIAQTLGLHFYTVDAIAQTEADYIAKAKEKLSKNAFFISQVALEKISDAMKTLTISKPEDIYKMALAATSLAEKGNLLSGGATHRVQVLPLKNYDSAEEFDKDTWGEDEPIEVK